MAARTTGGELIVPDERSKKLIDAMVREQSEKASLIADVVDIVVRLERLTKRVEEIARAPLPQADKEG